MSRESNNPPNNSSNQRFVSNGRYRGQDLSGLSAFSLSLLRCDFTQSDLTNTNFSSSNLSESLFDAARLRSSNFSGCRLHRISARMADFEDANLEGVNLQQSDLSSSVFFSSKLNEADLTDAQLQNSDLRRAQLQNANLSHANLKGADLVGANIMGATLDSIKADGARISQLLCTPEQRQHLLAAGAYEGLPPFVSRLQTNTSSFFRRISSLVQTKKHPAQTDEENNLPEQTNFFDEIKTNWKEWQNRQRNLQKRRNEEEETWRARQEADRIDHLRRRMEREEKRRLKIQEEALIKRQQAAVRKRIQDRRKQASRLQREINQIRKESRNQAFHNRSSRKAWDPYSDPEASQKKEIADGAFEAAENARLQETQIHDQLLQFPQDSSLMDKLVKAEDETRLTAQFAVQAETTHYAFVEELRELHREEIANAEELEREQRFQIEQAKKESAISAAIAREAALQAASDRSDKYLESFAQREEAFRNAAQVAILCKEQIRSEQAKQEAERLQREIELRLFEEEELNRKKHLVEETTQEESLEAERANADEEEKWQLSLSPPLSESALKILEGLEVPNIVENETQVEHDQTPVEAPVSTLTIEPESLSKTLRIDLNSDILTFNDEVNTPAFSFDDDDDELFAIETDETAPELQFKIVRRLSQLQKDNEQNFPSDNKSTSVLEDADAQIKAITDSDSQKQKTQGLQNILESEILKIRSDAVSMRDEDILSMANARLEEISEHLTKNKSNFKNSDDLSEENVPTSILSVQASSQDDLERQKQLYSDIAQEDETTDEDEKEISTDPVFGQHPSDTGKIPTAKPLRDSVPLTQSQIPTEQQDIPEASWDIGLSQNESLVLRKADLSLQDIFDKLSKEGNVEQFKKLIAEDTVFSTETDLHRLFNIPVPKETSDTRPLDSTEKDSNTFINRETALTAEHNKGPVEAFGFFKGEKSPSSDPLDSFDETEGSSPPVSDNITAEAGPFTTLQNTILDSVLDSQSVLKDAQKEAQNKAQREALANRNAKLAEAKLLAQKNILESFASKEEERNRLYRQKKSAAEALKKSKEEAKLELRKLDELRAEEEANAAAEQRLQAEAYEQAKANAQARFKELKQAQLMREQAMAEAEHAAEAYRQQAIKLKDSDAKANEEIESAVESLSTIRQDDILTAGTTPIVQQADDELEFPEFDNLVSILETSDAVQTELFSNIIRSRDSLSSARAEDKNNARKEVLAKHASIEAETQLQSQKDILESYAEQQQARNIRYEHQKLEADKHKVSPKEARRERQKLITLKAEEEAKAAVEIALQAEVYERARANAKSRFKEFELARLRREASIAKAELAAINYRQQTKVLRDNDEDLDNSENSLETASDPNNLIDYNLQVLQSIDDELDEPELDIPDFDSLINILDPSEQLQNELYDDVLNSREVLEKAQLEAESKAQSEAIASRAARSAQTQLQSHKNILETSAEQQQKRNEHYETKRIEAEKQKLSEEEARRELQRIEGLKAQEEAKALTQLKLEAEAYEKAKANAQARIHDLRQAQLNREEALNNAAEAARVFRNQKLKLQQQSEQEREIEDRKRAEMVLEAKRQARLKVQKTLKSLAILQSKRESANRLAEQAARELRQTLDAEEQNRIQLEALKEQEEVARLRAVAKGEEEKRQRIAIEERNLELQKQELNRLQEELSIAAEEQAGELEQEQQRILNIERVRQETERQQTLREEEQARTQLAKEEAIKAKEEAEVVKRQREAKAQEAFRLRQRVQSQQVAAARAAESVAAQIKFEQIAKLKAELAAESQKSIEEKLQRIAIKLAQRKSKRSKRLDSRTERFYQEQSAANRDAALQRLETGYSSPKVENELFNFPNTSKRIQRIWYLFTDKTAQHFPGLANALDNLKESIETRFAQRRASAYRERTRQSFETQRALEERQRSEHQARIAKLRSLQESEEKRAYEQLQFEADQAEVLAQKEALKILVKMEVSERHQHYRDLKRPEHPIDNSQTQFISKSFIGEQWAYAQLTGIELMDCNFTASNLMNSRLRSATLLTSQFNGANFDKASIDKSRIEASRFHQASFIGSLLRVSRIRDSVFTECDFTSANLEYTEWITCNLNGSDFEGINAIGAQFSGSQLKGATFRHAHLENSSFDQADLTDVNFTGAHVSGADFRGAIGLPKSTMEYLQDNGALVDNIRHQSLQLPQLKAAIVLFSLATGAFVFSYYTGQSPESNFEEMEQSAQVLLESDPYAAAEQYKQMSIESRRIPDKVTYLLEANAIYQQMGDSKAVIETFTTASQTADEDRNLLSLVQLQHGEYLIGQEKAIDALELLRPLYTQTGFNATDRAKLIILAEEAATKAAVDTQEELAPIFQIIEDLPDAQADLYMALAESRMERGEFEIALVNVAMASDIALSDDLKLRLLETRARIEDRSGDWDSAIATLQSIIEKGEDDNLSSQAAQLAMADIQLRQGDAELALVGLQNLNTETTDIRLKARGNLIEGRIYESLGNTELAIEKYQSISESSDADPETQEEARVSLSRVILNSGLLDDETISKDLPASVLTQAKLGQTRQLLDNSEYEAALVQYEGLLSIADLDPELKRAVLSGKAEALSGVGDYPEADTIWRQLLSQNLRESERQYIMLIQAHGLLQSGRPEEAFGAFTSLSQSSDKEIKHQGLMGLAEVSRANGERERAKGYYSELIQSTTSKDFKIDAYLELALISSEQKNSEGAQQAYQSILTLSPSQEIEGMAHAQLAELLSMTDPESAKSHCLEILNTESLLPCAELMARIDEIELAKALYERALEQTDSSSSLYGEICLGGARIDTEHSNTWVSLGLGTPLTDPVIELGLLQIALQSTGFLDSDREQFEAQFNSKIVEFPNRGAQVLMSQSVELRSIGNTDQALAVMERALELATEEELLSGIKLETADTYIENNQLSEANDKYEQLTENSDSQIANSARIGLSTVAMRNDDIKAAVEFLSSIENPTIELEELRLQSLSLIIQNTGNLQAIDLLSTLNNTEDESLRFLQHRAQALTHIANDELEEAENEFQLALSMTTDSDDISWTKLSLADVYFSQSKSIMGMRILDELKGESNLEINTQSRIRLSQWHLSNDEPKQVVSTLEDVSGFELGPGWDTSVEELRAQAYRDLGDTDKAIEILSLLAKRWPNNEEAEIPAWLGIAVIHQRNGTMSEAREWAQRAAERATDPIYQEQLSIFLKSL